MQGPPDRVSWIDRIVDVYGNDSCYGMGYETVCIRLLNVLLEMQVQSCIVSAMSGIGMANQKGYLT